MFIPLNLVNNSNITYENCTNLFLFVISIEKNNIYNVYFKTDEKKVYSIYRLLFLKHITDIKWTKNKCKL